MTFSGFLFNSMKFSVRHAKGRFGATLAMMLLSMFLGACGFQPAPGMQASDVPDSEVQASDVPASDSPASEAPISDSPALEAPASDMPISDVPASDVPISSMPEDAEQRVLSGEILYMQVSRDNHTAGRLDLDGDGQKEVLYLESLGNSFTGNGWSQGGSITADFRIRVNDSFYDQYCSNADPLLMAFSPDGKQILLAVYDDGPSNDPTTYFFRYDKTSVQPAGQIPADLRNATIDDNGVICCTFRTDMIETERAWGYYYWNGTEILLREDEVYHFVDDSAWRAEYNVPLVLLKEITVFAERSENSTPITMKPQEVRNAATDGSEWIFLEAKDGTAGWIRVVQFRFPSEGADVFELFEGLIMAD